MFAVYLQCMTIKSRHRSLSCPTTFHSSFFSLIDSYLSKGMKSLCTMLMYRIFLHKYLSSNRREESQVKWICILTIMYIASLISYRHVLWNETFDHHIFRDSSPSIVILSFIVAFASVWAIRRDLFLSFLCDSPSLNFLSNNPLVSLSEI